MIVIFKNHEGLDDTDYSLNFPFCFETNNLRDKSKSRHTRPFTASIIPLPFICPPGVDTRAVVMMTYRIDRQGVGKTWKNKLPEGINRNKCPPAAGTHGSPRRGTGRWTQFDIAAITSRPAAESQEYSYA